MRLPAVRSDEDCRRLSKRFRPAIRGPFRCKHRKEHRKRGPDRHDPRLGARVPGKECQELDDVPGRMEPLEIAGARKRLGNLKRGLAAGHARRVALAERVG